MSCIPVKPAAAVSQGYLVEYVLAVQNKRVEGLTQQTKLTEHQVE
jgi:hypothetical protein